MEQATDDDTAKQCRHRLNTLARHKRDHDRDKGKGRALHNRQAGANGSKPDGLKQRRNAGKQHRHLNKVGHIRKTLRPRIRPEPETGSPRNDNRRRHV